MDIAIDGDIDMDAERDRAMVSIVGDLDDLVGPGKVLEALQESPGSLSLERPVSAAG